jgi:hypothetical protein
MATYMNMKEFHGRIDEQKIYHGGFHGEKRYSCPHYFF